MKRVIVNWLLVVLWCSLIFYLSSTPILVAPIQISYIDLLGHAVFYAVLAILLARAIMTNVKPRNSKFYFIVVLLITLYGALIEIYQSYIPTRTASISDGVANLAGGCLGVLVYKVYTSKLSLRGSRRLTKQSRN